MDTAVYGREVVYFRYVDGEGYMIQTVMGMTTFTGYFIHRHGATDTALEKARKFNRLDLHKMSDFHTSKWAKMTHALNLAEKKGILWPLPDFPNSNREWISREEQCNFLEQVQLKRMTISSFYDGYVYFLYSKKCKVVKIGKTINPKGRFAKYVTESPEKLEKIALLRCHMDLETHLHNELCDFRTHGEWFKVNAKMLERLSNIIGDDLCSHETIESSDTNMGRIISSYHNKPDLATLIAGRDARAEEWRMDGDKPSVPLDCLAIARAARAAIAKASTPMNRETCTTS